VPREQRRLRAACLRGDVEAVQRLLLPRRLPRWKVALKAVLGPSLLHAVGIDTSTAAARLDYVYCDDHANMPIHYIAKGQAGLLPRLARVLLPAGEDSAGTRRPHSACADARAALLAYLIAEVAAGRQSAGGACLSAVNSSLETPLHCAIRSASTPVVEQLLRLGLPTTQDTSAADLRSSLILQHGAAPTAKLTQTLVEESMVPLDARDDDGWAPLDLAVSLRRWPIVRLLLEAGAHEAPCPGLQDAEQALAEWLAKLRQPSAPCRPAASGSGTTQGGVIAGVAKLSRNLLGGMAGTLFRIASNAVGYDTASSPLLREAQAEDRGERAPGAADSPTGRISAAVVYDSTAEVAQRQQAAAEHVAYVVGVNPQAAAALLTAHGGHAEAAIEAYMSDPARACEAAGLSEAAAGYEPTTSETGAAAESGSAPAETGAPAAAPMCIVCYDDVTPGGASHRVAMACGHVCCDQCWLGLLTARLDDGDVHRTICPAEDCQLPLPLPAARKILPDDLYARYSRLVGQKAVDTAADLRWCPNPGCERSLELGADQHRAFQHSVAVECACGHRFCWACSGAPHEPATCDQMTEWQGLMRAVVEEAEEHTKNWMSSATKGCPRCSARIQKTGGCNHMVCSNCSYQFCWMCMGEWRLHNRQTGGFYACTLEAAQPADQSAAASTTAPPAPGAAATPPRAQSRDTTAGLLQGVYRAVQMPFRNMRLAYHMRSYSQHTQYTWQDLAGAAAQINELWQLSGIHCCGEVHDLCTAFLGADKEQGPGEGAHGGVRPGRKEEGRQAGLGLGQGAGLLQLLDGATPPGGPLVAGLPPAASALPREGENGLPLLLQWARITADAHTLLCHSYVLGWFMAWGRCRRYFEHLLGELENAVDVITTPLTAFPASCAPPPPRTAAPGRREQAQLQPQRQSLQCRQFYHALVVHRQLAEVLGMLSAVQTQSRGLIRKARRGVFATACRENQQPSMPSAVPAAGNSAAVSGQARPPTATEPTPG